MRCPPLGDARVSGNSGAVHRVIELTGVLRALSDSASFCENDAPISSDAPTTTAHGR